MAATSRQNSPGRRSGSYAPALYFGNIRATAPNTKEATGDSFIIPPSSDYEADESDEMPLESSSAQAEAEAEAEANAAAEAASPSSVIPSDAISSTGERTRTETFVVIMALSMSLFLAALDSTIITTAVPTIAAHFQSSSGYIWIGSAYLLGNAAFVPTWGEVSGIFGRKPVLLFAVGIFLLGSLLCGVSQSMGMLIAARAIQGVGSGGAIVLPNLCVSDLFSLRKRGMYFGLLGMVWALASAVGPVIGGVFTDRVSWRWCFYINLPIGGVALLILTFFLKLHNPRTPIGPGLAAIDWVGNLLIIGATLMVLLGLEFGGVAYPWKSTTVICLIIFGAVTAGFFVVYEAQFAKFPVIPLHLFRHRTSIASYALSILHAITFIGGSYWLPLYFQSVLAATPLLSGVYLLPFVLSLSFCSSLVGVMIKRTGNYKLPISAGFLVSILGYGLFTYLGDRPHWERVMLFQIVAGIGVGPNFQAPLVALQTNVEQRDIGAATASFAFLRQIGNSISVTIGGTVFNNLMQGQNERLAAIVGSDLADMFSGNSAASNTGMVRSLPSEYMQPVQSAYWNALQDMFIMYTSFCFVGFLVSLFVQHKVLSKQHTEYKTGLASLNKTSRNKPSIADEEKNVIRNNQVQNK
jgi:EmrB/QacA subfamily drug resistance transporter